jgi:hypothetical protein
VFLIVYSKTSPSFADRRAEYNETAMGTEMINKGLFFSFVIALLLLSACTRQPAVSNQAPSGTWSGEYGLGPDRRESISVDLRWEDGNLRGIVHAGPRSLPLTKASFTAETGAISMEFDAEGNRGRIVHYIIDGKVNGKTMTGTWAHDDEKGDFHVTKQ